jgi:pimeloyl-ACP methyl ester carboxylesterase
MRSGVAAVILLPALLSCVASFHPVQPTGDEVTIFIPGYKGSFLVTDGEPEERAWINPGAVLTSGRRTLALPFEGERTLPVFGPLHEDGPLTRLTLIPLLAEADIYKTWMDDASRTLPDFIPFGYDWRQDIRVPVARLAALIDRLQAGRTTPRRINLVCHSMGGLIALYYLRYGSDGAATAVTWDGARHVQRVVFAGTPFRGSPIAFRDLQTGTATGLNKALLSRDALFTFASVFQLLPASDDFLFSSGDRLLNARVSDPVVWISTGWSVFSDPTLRENLAYRLQLARMLSAHTEIVRALGETTSAPPETLRTLVVVGTGRPTVSGLRLVDGRVDGKHHLLADGDDSVPSANATPPSSLPYRRLDTGAIHAGILNDSSVRAEIIRFLHE